MADTEQTPDKKEYSLKPIEVQMITTAREQMTTIVTNFLSFIGIERLAYPVTQYTMFELSADMKTVKLWENPPEPATGEQEPQVEVAPSSDTAKAIKGQK